jgi:hypothetical protein
MTPPTHARKPRPASVAEMLRAQSVLLADLTSQVSALLDSVTSMKRELKAELVAIGNRFSRSSLLEDVER